jgi:hypothetical protein
MIWRHLGLHLSLDYVPSYYPWDKAHTRSASVANAVKVLRYIIYTSKSSSFTVANFIDFLSLTIRDWSGQWPLLLVQSTGQIDKLPGGIVFAIGQGLSPFSPCKSTVVVFLNFSVMWPVRAWPHYSMRSLLLMYAKRKKFLSRLSAVDMIFDFYPAHYNVIKRKFPKVVFGTFPVAVYADRIPYLSLDGATYDVCVLGSQSRRRRVAWRALQRVGLKLSPTHGVLESIVPSCRITANVHMERYDNCEVHRILSSLAMGRPVVTEPIYGFSEIRTWPGVHACPLSDMPDLIRRLVCDRESLAAQSRSAYDFYWDHYWYHARAEWFQILEKVSSFAAAKWNTHTYS